MGLEGRSSKKVFVIGAGGHAKVVVSLLQECRMHVAGLFDDDPQKWGTEILGVRILGPINDIKKYAQEGQFIIGIGNNRMRHDLARKWEGVLSWLSIAHPTAYVHSSVNLGPGTVVFAGAVVQPHTIIGRHSIINTGATVDHDCKLGSYVHIAPGVHVAGGVNIGEGTMLGIGASVLPGKRIGRWVTVGAGAVVIDDLADNVTAVGVPARVIRRRADS